MATQLRSWLVVPADEPAKLAKVAGLDADVIVLDLACAAPGAKAEARRAAAEYLGSRPAPSPGIPGMRRWVRINPLGSAHLREDLTALMPHAPDGFILPRATGAQQVATLASEIYELEQTSPAQHNSVRIVPQLGDVPAGIMNIGQLIENPHPRLAGIAWDAETLMTSAGMRPFGKAPHRWPAPVAHARAQIVLAARSAGLFAIDTPSSVTRDAELFRAIATESRAAGFDAMFARHPAQVAPIGRIFAPNAEERERASAIVAAFQAEPEAQVVSIDRRSADRAELARAKGILGID